MESLPRIVIVGRQNVGKSSLFNALAKKRIAIVSPKPGITRDYIECKIKINKKEIIIIDIGGITDSKNKNDLEYITTLKTKEILQKADLILFVLEKNKLTPMDEEIAKIIRKSNKKTVLVVNKVDNYNEINSPDTISLFYSLGFDNIIPISATHRKNFDALFNLIEKLLPESKITQSEKENIKIAIVGKPNVGKSSILNSLINDNRAIVTDIPGTTRDNIDTILNYNDKLITLIDTAGIRKKSRINEDIEYYSVNRAINAIKRSDISLMIISASEGISNQEKKIFYLINEYKKASIIILNKWDLIKSKNIQYFKKIISEIFPMFSHFPILNVSALTGLNINKIIPKALEVYNNYTRRIPTSEFNKFVQNIINTYSPPQKGVGTIKIYYGTEYKIKPPSFIFFTNKPDEINENYKRFLINKIYENFNFEGSPIIIKFRKK